MPLFALVWGMLAYGAMVVGLVSALRLFNWLTVPFAGLGMILSLAALASWRSRRDTTPVAALVCNMIAVIVGTLRLWGGAGI